MGAKKIGDVKDQVTCNQCISSYFLILLSLTIICLLLIMASGVLNLQGHTSNCEFIKLKNPVVNNSICSIRKETFFFPSVNCRNTSGEGSGFTAVVLNYRMK